MAGPSTTGDNGRDGRGRFAPGNGFARGNPHARRVAELRSALLDTLTPRDIEAVVRALIDAGKGGDVSAAKELLNRALGPPVAADLLERLEILEARLADVASEHRP